MLQGPVPYILLPTPRRFDTATPPTFLLQSLHLTALALEVIFCRGLAALRQALPFISSW